MAEPPPLPPDRFQQLYNDATSADVDVSGPRTVFWPRRSGSRNTVKAHRIVLSAGSGAFRRYFEKHRKQDNVDFEDVVDAADTPEIVLEMVLKYLYGQPIFTDGEDRNPYLLERLHDFADKFEIPSLREHTVVLFERSLEAHIVDLETGLVKAEPNVLGVLQYFYLANKTASQPLDQVIVKLGCKYYDLMSKHERFARVLEANSALPNLMLQYISRQRGGCLL